MLSSAFLLVLIMINQEFGQFRIDLINFYVSLLITFQCNWIIFKFNQI